MIDDRQKRQRQGRLKMVLIVAVFIVPLLGAWLLLQRVQQGEVWATSNKGDLLLPPRELPKFVFEGIDQQTYSQENLQGQWLLLYFAAPSCGELCKRSIYHMRQIRAALGKDMHRVQRLLILQDKPQLAALADFLDAYPDMLQILQADNALAMVEFAQAFKREGHALYEAIFLVDPLGNVVMAFPQELNPRAVLKDLKKLLKASKIG